MNYSALIIGGGVAGMQCALVLGSAKKKAFATDKQIGILLHQKASQLQNALFNNVLRPSIWNLGSIILSKEKNNLHLYIHNFSNRKRKSTCCYRFMRMGTK